MAKLATFDVELMYGGDLIELGTYTYTDTVLKLKQYYCDNIDNSKNLDQLEFAHGGRVMDNHRKLGYYDNDVEFSMIIVFTYKVCGGGDFMLMSGPDVNAKVKQSKWNHSAPNYRVCEPGFAIEWIYDGKKVIGNLGFGTFEMNKSKSTKQAYCGGLDIYYDGVSKITEYWFNNCKVEFEGELPGSKPFNKKKTFGDMACRFEGGAQKKKYRWLDITVKKL